MMGFYSRIKKNDKMHIKYMYFRNGVAKTRKIYIAFLTDDYQYVEFEFIVLKNCITPTLATRIRMLFSDFEIDRNSVIIYDDKFENKHPFYQYIMFLHQHMQFNLRKVSRDLIVNRINAYHQYIHFKNGRTFLTYMQFNALWQKLIKFEKCPWITNDIDNQLKQHSVAKAQQSRICRMGMYYMVVKDYLTKKVQKSQSKRAEKSN